MTGAGDKDRLHVTLLSHDILDPQHQCGEERGLTLVRTKLKWHEAIEMSEKIRKAAHH